MKAQPVVLGDTFHKQTLGGDQDMGVARELVVEELYDISCQFQVLRLVFPHRNICTGAAADMASNTTRVGLSGR